MTFKVGDKVRFNYDPTVGKVLEVRDDNVETGAKYLISWGKGTSTPDWEHGDQLVLVDAERDKEISSRVQAKIDQAKSLLEMAWEAWQGARELANEESDFYYLQDQNLINLHGFGTAAENFGWSSSSLYCS